MFQWQLVYSTRTCRKRIDTYFMLNLLPSQNKIKTYELGIVSSPPETPWLKPSTSLLFWLGCVENRGTRVELEEIVSTRVVASECDTVNRLAGTVSAGPSNRKAWDTTQFSEEHSISCAIPRNKVVIGVSVTTALNPDADAIISPWTIVCQPWLSYNFMVKSYRHLKLSAWQS